VVVGCCEKEMGVWGLSGRREDIESVGCSGGKMGADVQDVGMALGSSQGRGLEAAVKGKTMASRRGCVQRRKNSLGGGGGWV
jgi:hypothetical protein